MHLCVPIFYFLPHNLDPTLTEDRLNPAQPLFFGSHVLIPPAPFSGSHVLIPPAPFSGSHVLIPPAPFSAVAKKGEELVYNEVVPPLCVSREGEKKGVSA